MPASAYSPSSNLQANLPQSTVKYYDKKFRENLKHQTPFVACAERLDLPMKSGNNYNLFMYSTFAQNTVQANEGEVDAGQVAAVVSTNANIGEYADYANFSSLSLATAIDNTVENVGKELAYRLGQSLSALVKTTADGGTSVDSSVLVKLAATSTTVFTALSIDQLRSSVESLRGRAVRPFHEDQSFAGIIHPFALGDLQTGTTANGVIDILKHTPVGMSRMDELAKADITEIVELPGVGVKFFQSGLVTKTANYNPGGGAISGLTALRTYIFGRDGIFTIKLGANGDTAFGDGAWENIDVTIMQDAPKSVADPEGLIPGWCSYKVHFTTSLGPDTTLRYRMIDAASAVS